MLPEKRGDRIERDSLRARVIGDIDDLDVAPRLAVVRYEPLGLVPREVGIIVVIVVDDVRSALYPKRRWHRDLLAAFEEQHRVAFDHRGFGLPISVVFFLHADREGGRIGTLLQLLGVAVAR